MLYLQKGENLQCLQQVSCFFLDIPIDTAMYMYMYAFPYSVEPQLVHLSTFKCTLNNRRLFNSVTVDGSKRTFY